MTTIINIFFVSLGALFLSIPIFNKYVFHTANIDQIIADGKVGVAKMTEFQSAKEFDKSDSCGRVLIDQFRNDSSEFFIFDIKNWDVFLKTVKENPPSKRTTLLIGKLNELDQGLLRDYKNVNDLTPEVKKQFVGFLNNIVNDSLFYIKNSAHFPAISNRLQNELEQLIEKGILQRSGVNVITVKPNLSRIEWRLLKKFHVAYLNQIVFADFLNKDYRRGMDWASEYIAQTALYTIGSNYQARIELDDAIRVYDSLILLYPRTIYAEVVFLEIGKALLADGKNKVGSGQIQSANELFRKAIFYFEKIEQNREISRQFPKYKYADLQPDQYVNIDVASKAKRKVKQETAIYTAQKAKEEAIEKAKNNESGFYLEDAVRLIGECFVQIGETDSARSQFNLILKYFPESDNLDNAQKLIADSYVKDGDVLLIQDSTSENVRSKANEKYNLAIKEYLKFINIFPQSDLISETFISLGDAYHKLGLKNESENAFASALGRAKDLEEQAKIQLKIGNYFFDKKRYSEAIKAYDIILKNFFNSEVSSNAQYLQGECFEKIGDTTKAIKAFTIIMEHHKQSSFFGNSAKKIGDWNFERKNYKAALDAYSMGYNYIDKRNDLASRMLFQKGMVWRKIAEGQTGKEKETSLLEAIKQFSEVVKAYENRDADQASYQIADIQFLLGNEKAAREAAKSINSKDILLTTLKIFKGKDKEDDPEEELKFWNEAVETSTEDEERATAWYEKGLVLFDKSKNYEGALAAFDSALAKTKKPEKVISIRIGISRVFTTQQRFSESQKILTELLQSKNVAAELRLQLQIQLYDVYYRDKQLDKALDGFESFVALQPQHAQTPYALFRIGSIYADKGDYKKAIDKLKIVEQKYTESSVYDEVILSIGQQMISLGQHKEAIDYLENFIKKNKEIGTAASFYFRLAETYSRYLANTKKAFENYKMVVDNYSTDRLFSYAAYKLGSLYLQDGDESNAKKILELVKREDASTYRAAQADIGKIIAKTNPEAAIKNYTKIVEESETAEDSAVALIGIGDVYATIKKWPDAASSYEHVYKSYKGKDTTIIVGSLIKWVDALVNAKKPKDAINVAAIAQKDFPDNPLVLNAIYYEANSYFTLEDFTKAYSSFQKLAKAAEGKNPQLQEIAYYQKADCLYFKNSAITDTDKKAAQMKLTVKEYNEYVQKYPKGKYAARALFMQGNSYVMIEEYALAKEMLETVVNKYPEFEDICNAKNFYALSLTKLKKTQQALKVFAEVKKSGSCSEKARDFAKKQYEDNLITQ